MQHAVTMIGGCADGVTLAALDVVDTLRIARPPEVFTKASTGLPQNLDVKADVYERVGAYAFKHIGTEGGAT
jgi:hypothetical protein